MLVTHAWSSTKINIVARYATSFKDSIFCFSCRVLCLWKKTPGWTFYNCKDSTKWHSVVLRCSLSITIIHDKCDQLLPYLQNIDIVSSALKNTLDYYLEEYFFKPSAIVSYSVGHLVKLMLHNIYAKFLQKWHNHQFHLRFKSQKCMNLLTKVEICQFKNMRNELNVFLMSLIDILKHSRIRDKNPVLN